MVHSRVYTGARGGRSGEKAVEIGLGEMKSLESPVKQLGLEDTMTFEQGCDMVIREVCRTNYSCGLEGHTLEEGAIVLQACWGQGDVWIGVFYPCTVMVGSGVGSSLSWQERVFITDTVENR